MYIKKSYFEKFIINILISIDLIKVEAHVCMIARYDDDDFAQQFGLGRINSVDWDGYRSNNLPYTNIDLNKRPDYNQLNSLINDLDDQYLGGVKSLKHILLFNYNFYNF